MGQINVRRVKTTDYRYIYLLNQELGYFYPVEKAKEKIENIVESTKDIILVAERDKEVIGYIHGSPYESLFFDPFINILGFVVKEKYRNMGIGSLLLNSLEC